MRNQRGITLIALVITIIVLLILAGVSIQAVLGENGMATKAKNAKQQTEIGTEKEQITIAYTSCKLENAEDDVSEIVSASQLQTEMNNSYGAGIVEVTGSELLKISYIKTDRNYFLLPNGIIADADVILENLTYENSVGIAEDGSLVDMTLWGYDHGYDYSGNEWYTIGGPYYGSSISRAAYYGEFINGRIEGQIPAYVLDLRYDEEFLPVTSFTCVFNGCEELEYAPQIPSTITNIEAAFWWCVNLKEAPVISENITSIEATFAGCSSLTGKLIINANPIYYANCFVETSINEGCDLVLSGSSTILEEILERKSDDSNIRIGN